MPTSTILQRCRPAQVPVNLFELPLKSRNCRSFAQKVELSHCSGGLLTAGFSQNQRNTGGPRSASATARSLKKIDRRYSCTQTNVPNSQRQSTPCLRVK